MSFSLRFSFFRSVDDVNSPLCHYDLAAHTFSFRAPFIEFFFRRLLALRPVPNYSLRPASPSLRHVFFFSNTEGTLSRLTFVSLLPPRGVPSVRSTKLNSHYLPLPSVVPLQKTPLECFPVFFSHHGNSRHLPCPPTLPLINPQPLSPPPSPP